MTSLYGNVGGSQKAISYLYSNIANAQKEIYPNNQLYADGTIYIWDKYSLDSDFQYRDRPSTYVNYYSITLAIDYVYIADSYSFDPETGTYGLASNYRFGINRKLSDCGSEGLWQLCDPGQYITITSADYLQGDSRLTYGQNLILSPPDGCVLVYAAGSGRIYSVPQYNISLSNSGPVYARESVWEKYYFQGSTSYGEVTSTKSNAYPQNGYSNEYWYVYKGTTTAPITYTQISGIKVSGNARIDTGIKADNNTRMIMDFNIPSLTAQQALCGARNSGGSGGFAIFTYNSNAGFQIDFSSYQQYPVPATGTYTGRHTLDLNKNKFYLDGSLVHTFTNTAFTGSYNIFIGSINNGGSAMTAYPADGLIIYPCKIYTNGSLVRDYVPAKTPDGLVGLFDKVDRVLYTNAGTGSFIGIE